MMNLEDAARSCGVPVALLARVVQLGLVPACRHLGEVLVRPHEIEAFLAEDFHGSLQAARQPELVAVG